MSSRVKKCLEPTVEKYILFLVDIKNSAGYESYSLSQFISDCKINKSVRRALIDLAIIDYENDNKWTWLSFEPDRVLALTMLNYLLERSKKSRATVIAGLEETNAVLRSLSEKVTEYIHKRETALKVPQIASNGNLFSEVDTKAKERFEMAKSIASGVFKDWATINDYQAYGHRIIAATDHILELLNKK